MPKLDEPEKIERNPIPAGEYEVKLTAIKPTENINPFETVLNPETGKAENPIRREWIWQFETSTPDPKTGKPYEYAVWTPRYFNPSSDRNKLTLLVRMLAPDAAVEELRGMIEMDDFIGKRWKVRIISKTSKSGKVFPSHLYFLPIVEVPV